MATRLPGTDVVVVGLGAAGGVAVLPLAQAGLDIVGLEAGSRLTPALISPPTRYATTCAPGRLPSKRPSMRCQRCDPLGRRKRSRPAVTR